VLLVAIRADAVAEEDLRSGLDIRFDLMPIMLIVPHLADHIEACLQ
jgi:hypothetical protein